MKKKKEIEIPKTQYIYQRHNGIITKYIINEEYYIAVETGIATKKDETILLGNVAKNIIDLIEVGDIVNNGYICEIGNSENGYKWVHNLNGFLLFEKDIKTILTHEQYQANCYTVEKEQKNE